MDKNAKKTTHTESNTTVRINAGLTPMFCRFFCNRVTESDVIDPSKTSKKESDEHPTIEPANPSLCEG